MIIKDREVSYKKHTKITIKDIDNELVVVQDNKELLKKVRSQESRKMLFKYELNAYDEEK